MTNNHNKEQFLDILERHIGIIIKISGAYAGTQEERKDLIQDIILQLWRSFDRFNGSCKISTWIYRVSLNISMNYKRKYDNSFVLTSLSEFKEKDAVLFAVEQTDTSELEILYRSIGKSTPRRRNKPHFLLDIRFTPWFTQPA